MQMRKGYRGFGIIDDRTTPIVNRITPPDDPKLPASIDSWLRNAASEQSSPKNSKDTVSHPALDATAQPSQQN